MTLPGFGEEFWSGCCPHCDRREGLLHWPDCIAYLEEDGRYPKPMTPPKPDDSDQ